MRRIASSTWMRSLRKAATFVITVYIGLMLLLFVAQTSLIFIPSNKLHIPPEHAAWNIEDVTLEVDNECRRSVYASCGHIGCQSVYCLLQFGSYSGFS